MMYLIFCQSPEVSLSFTRYLIHDASFEQWDSEK
jgi:hypothetical protein